MHKKEIQGQIFNGNDYTLRLPEEKNRKILDRIQNIKRFTTKTPRKVMEKLADSLQHISLDIPVGVGLFSVTLQGTIQWLRITPDLTQYLQDWAAVINHMGRHTTQVRQLVNKLTHYIVYSDSCGIGTGEV